MIPEIRHPKNPSLFLVEGGWAVRQPDGFYEVVESLTGQTVKQLRKMYATPVPSTPVVAGFQQENLLTETFVPEPEEETGINTEEDSNTVLSRAERKRLRREQN